MSAAPLPGYHEAAALVAARAAELARRRPSVERVQLGCAAGRVLAQVIAADQDVHGIIFDSQSRNLFYDTWIGK